MVHETDKQGKKLSSFTYRFNHISNCNMCSAVSDNFKIIGRRLNQSQGLFPKYKAGITTTVCKCRTCGLIFANPQPIPVSLQDHYNVEPEEYWKKDCFQYDDSFFKREFNLLKSLINFKNGMKSLDIGAGLGKKMVALEKFGFDSHGFEPSRSFYEYAISRMENAESRLKLGMIEDMEYPEEYFDFISISAVLEHLYNPSSAIIKALSWLKPNGIIHIEVPSADWLVGKIINLFYSVTLSGFAGNLSPMHNPYHLYEFGLKSFQCHAKANNYRIVHTDYYVCDTYMPKIIDFLLKPLMKYTNTGLEVCVWIQKNDPCPK